MAVIAGRGVGSGRAGVNNNNSDDIASGGTSVNIAQREDLANFISMLTRDETPFMSSIGKTKATAIYHEWQTDQLAPPGNSRVGEGIDYILPEAYTVGGGTVTGTNDGSGLSNGAAQGTVGNAFAHTGPNRTRLGNYAQINGKSIAISGTRRVIDTAGVADEYAYQLKKRGTELRRDIERDLIHSHNVANGSGQRSFGGYQAWINKEISLEGGIGGNDNFGGNVKYKGNITEPGDTGNGTAAPTASSTTITRGSLSLSDIDEVMQSIYQNGGKAGKLMLSPKLRRDFSDLMVTDSGVRRNIDMDGKLRQSVDVYMSDFGDVMVVPNYIMGLTSNATINTATVNLADFSALLYDPSWFAIATLRPLHEVDVGQRGDSTIGMMVEECTLEVKNPQGPGAIYGLS